MPTLRLSEIVEASGGMLLRGDGETRVDSYSIDTRTLAEGGVFFALRGSRRDGHEFLGDATRAGAAAAVVEADPGVRSLTPRALIRVADTAAALARCGSAARRKRPLKVIALTGSTGKTTTKELLAAGLSGQLRVHRTMENLNNHLGVPLTLLACPDDAAIAVIEMGMSRPGEIASLTRIADPDVGLVTNVRPVHLQFFESIEDIAAAKGELFAMLRHDAISVVNLDDERVRVQAARHPGTRVTFGRSPSADLCLEAIEDRFVPGAGLVFRHDGRSCRVQLRIGGSHAAQDAMAALAAVLAMGGDLDAAARAMSEVEPGKGRGQIHQLPNGGLLVDDTYNSSPAAMASLLDTLRASECAGRRVLVMGDMLELGPEEMAYHRTTGEKAAAAGVQLLVGVGPRSQAAVDAARKAGVPETYHDSDAVETARSFPPRVRPGDLVLLKGSRGMHLEQVVEALLSARVEGR